MIIATILTSIHSITYDLVELTEPSVHYAIAPAIIAAIGLAAQLGGSDGVIHSRLGQFYKFISD